MKMYKPMGLVDGEAEDLRLLGFEGTKIVEANSNVVVPKRYVDIIREKWPKSEGFYAIAWNEGPLSYLRLDPYDPLGTVDPTEYGFTAYKMKRSGKKKRVITLTDFHRRLLGEEAGGTVVWLGMGPDQVCHSALELWGLNNWAKYWKKFADANYRDAEEHKRFMDFMIGSLTGKKPSKEDRATA